MCKKMLQSLMGGGQEPAPPATPEGNYKGGKEAEVLGAVAADPNTGKTNLSGGLADPKRKKMGVPGLGL